jgi:hypothetical protein
LDYSDDLKWRMVGESVSSAFNIKNLSSLSYSALDKDEA